MTTTKQNSRIKPDWLKIRLPLGENVRKVSGIIKEHKLHTICTSGSCPNQAECWGAGTATFMILGDVCTRACRFCDVKTGRPETVDILEPDRLANSISLLKLKHAVITSVDRDDLEDGGAFIWAETIRRTKEKNPGLTMEVLIPDFNGIKKHIQQVINAGPDVISHNLETVRRLTPEIRTKAKYDLSLKVLEFNQAGAENPDTLFQSNYSELSSTQINPGVSLGASKTLFKNTELSLWFGRVQRSGSLAERFINSLPVGIDPYEMLGNPKIDPEVNNQFDISMKWAKKRSQVQANFFVSYLQNYISSEIREDISPRMSSAPGVRQFVNIDNAMMYGFEFSWSNKLPLGLSDNFSTTYTVANDIDTDDPLPEIPPLEIAYTLSGSYFKNILHPNISFRYAMKQENISEKFGETETPEFALFDAGIRVNPWDDLSIAIGVQNLFDKLYYEHLSRNFKIDATRSLYAPGRSFYVTLGVNL
jgi:hypothetical protein